jgi:hypothetical protein
VLQLMGLNSKLAALESEWKTVEPKKKAAEEMKQQLARNQKILDDLQSWKHARIPWNEQILGILRETPPGIQLSALRVSQMLEIVEKKNVPARNFTMVLDGRAQGASAEQDVQLLQRRLQQSPPFADAIRKEDGVQVPKFAADPSPQAGKSDRVFQILSLYGPRTFEVEAPRKSK